MSRSCDDGSKDGPLDKHNQAYKDQEEHHYSNDFRSSKDDPLGKYNQVRIHQFAFHYTSYQGKHLPIHHTKIHYYNPNFQDEGDD